MLSEIYQKLGIGKDGASEIDPDFIQSAIATENTWGIPWKYHGLITNTDGTPPEVSEVVNFLDMWSFIEEGFEVLGPADIEELEQKAQPWGKNARFRGFDGNNETEHMSIMRFLTRDLERFSRFKDRDINSHMPTVGIYRRMYGVFEPIRRTLAERKLSLYELIDILKAAER